MKVSTKDSTKVHKATVLMKLACFHSQKQLSDSAMLVRKVNRNLICHFQRSECAKQGS